MPRTSIIITIFTLVLIIATAMGVIFLDWPMMDRSANKQHQTATVFDSQTQNGTNSLFDNLDRTNIKPLDSYLDKIPTSGKFVTVDLGTNEILMYENGTLIDKATVKSQGQNGSFWQTPTGYYEITYTAKNHISSIGNVAMPYSAQYSGNFFIHGWPTELDGTPVAQGYSGGCIRLSTDEAKKVFDFLPTGNKVLVVNTNNLESATSDFELDSDARQSFPKLTANEFILANLVTGEMIAAETNYNTTHPLKSISNFIVAMTVNEWISYNTQVPQYVATAQGYQPQGISLVPEAMYSQLLDDDVVADEINYAVTNYRGRNFFSTNALTKAGAIGMNDAEILTPSLESGLTYLRAPLDEWFHLTRYLYFQKDFLLEESNGYVKTNAYNYYRDTDGTGFAIFTAPDRDPIILITPASTDFETDVTKINTWLQTYF